LGPPGLGVGDSGAPVSEAGTGASLLTVDSLSKAFGNTRALDGVSLKVVPGEVHALLGQNGSGKSTLIKILAGYVAADGGSVDVRGEMSFVHQDLGLVESMSVLDNLRLRRYETGALGRIRWRSERVRARNLLARFGLTVDLDTPVAAVPQSTKAIVAVLRALQDFDGRQETALLVLDEPTVALPQYEVELLFEVIRRIRDAGASVLFVTHRLQEVLAIADRVSVLRDGRLVVTREIEGLAERELIRLIVGRDVEALGGDHAGPEEGADRILAVSDLSGDIVRDVSFSVRRGEIVGLTGLIGAGHDEVPYLLFGAPAPSAGKVEVAGRTPGRLTPRRAKEAGLGLLPADRHRLAGIPGATLRENVTLPVLERYAGRFRFIRRRAEQSDVADVLTRLEVRPPLPERLLTTLSGGNQQKALLGRWLHASPHVLLLHEPTQGIDVGARQAIFETLRNAADAGLGIVYSSAEHEDLARICDRVLIFHEGRLVRTMSGTLDANEIADACYHLDPSGGPA
jgi:ribose transport system ATP-binding protein